MNKKIALEGPPYRKGFGLILKNVLNKKDIKTITISLTSNIDTLKKEEVNIINFNWLMNYHFEIQNTLFKTILSVISFLKITRNIKQNNIKLYWTMHNMYPHDTTKKIKVFLLNFIMLRVMDQIIVFSNW